MKVSQIKTRAIYRQHGMVTMFFVLMLVVLMSIMSMTAGKFAMVEQETSGAAYRAQEAAEATTAGLEYALAWLDNDNKCLNCITGTTLDFEGASVTGAEMPDISYAGTGYSYNPSVTLTAGNSFAPGFLLVKSTLGTVGGNTESGVTITGSEEVWITQWNSYLTPDGGGVPPIVVNGCMMDTTGSPTVYPKPGGPAILTVASSLPVDWSDPNAPTGYCLDPGHMNIMLCSGATCNVGDAGTGVPTDELDPYLEGVDLTLNPSPQAWNYVFKISLPEAKDQAAAAGQSTSDKNSITVLQPTNDDYLPFIVYSGDQPISGNKTFGSIAYPVVFIVSHEDCPQFNGGSTIYGYLYYENPLGTCNGMGGATIIGSGIFEGNAVKLNANTEFYDPSLLGGGNPAGPLFVEYGARIPGTWRDW